MTGFGQEETAGNGILKEILEVVWAPITLGPALSPALQQFSVQIFRSGPGREAMLQYQGPCLREAQKTRELSPEPKKEIRNGLHLNEQENSLLGPTLARLKRRPLN
ncbi:hypothetical protein Y1Q_0000659 [Alligator mississippiensis]|uniref:Uncharacterized protein n=1 Tax=Alligator mississippiensis TaxID=8496 RepID=A0A151MBX9_ALLMI|nr:hypothetical protein Y1Q_0000659 [Alligator mississippiensis]